MRIAVVGAGISGLVAAERLQRSRHEVTLFEAGDHLGGHTLTSDVEIDGRTHAVDAGFVVFNEATYPEFTRLLARLGVATKPTSMSFSVRCERSGLEYCGTSLNTFFAQRRNLLRLSWYRLLAEIVRFNRLARAEVGRTPAGLALGEFLYLHDFSPALVERYLVPMTAAIWSSDPERMLETPAGFLFSFLDNHRLLSVDAHHPWRVVAGGSRRYVEALTAPFRDRVRLRTPVRRIVRRARSVEVRTDAGAESFDQVVVAAHSDQALALLAEPTPREREVLGAIPYQRNEAVLHTDPALLPKNRRARASWNYLVPAEPVDRVLVTYDMSRLQGLPTREPVCVSLNLTERVAPGRVLRKFTFRHPLFTPAAVAAQARRSEISGVGRVHYCGAYWGNGFHEDGVVSGLAAAAAVERKGDR